MRPTPYPANRRLLPLLALVAALLAGGTARAASLALVPVNPGVGPGDTVTVDVLLDATGAPGATPGLYGGQFVIDFDPLLLAYADFTPVAGVTFFSPPTVGSSGSRQTVTIGFENSAGDGLVGAFQFTALGPAGSLATIGLADADDFFGTFISYVPTIQPFYPSFSPTAVSIVPLPAAAWLLATGVAVLAGRSRFRPQRA